MAAVVTPISAELRDLALRLAPKDATLPEALAAAKGQEHLLTESGFTAHLAHLLDVRCPSPGQADYLLDLALDIEAVIARVGALTSPADLAHLQKYAQACRLIAEIAGFQQGLLLAFMQQELVDRPTAERLGIPLDRLDMTRKLLKLARKNSDGSHWQHGEEWR